MSKFKNKYRVESNRMPGWDYSGNGQYFITLVTQNRECNLGTVENGKMILSDFGKIIEIEWYKSFEIRKELSLDGFIIMPNHLHAIVILKKDKIGLHDMDGLNVDARPCISSIHQPIPKTTNKINPQTKINIIIYWWV